MFTGVPYITSEILYIYLALTNFLVLFISNVSYFHLQLPMNMLKAKQLHYILKCFLRSVLSCHKSQVLQREHDGILLALYKTKELEKE